MRETLDMLWQGGWPMLVLGVCSVVAVMVVVERALALRRRNVLSPRVVDAIEAYRTGESPGAAERACRESGGAFARLMLEVLALRGMEHAQAIESMHASGRTQVSKLERGLTLLEIIAGVAPLIGLLGTVLGMVDVFGAISARGLGNPQVLSSGISQALITTVAGLFVGIPALAFHSLLAKRVEEYAVEMQDRATRFILKLQGAAMEREEHGPARTNTD